MIEFYRIRKSRFCDEVAERLQVLVVAHRVHWIDLEAQEGGVPRLTEGKKIYENEDAILSFLNELSRELIVQREMQSDSCKIDPETGEGCL